MNSLLDWFTSYCINNQLISGDDEAWFRYGLEKRLCTVTVLVPFAMIAVRISGFWTALSYITSFFYLRSQTNGYHAKTHWGCLLESLLLEAFFLMYVEPRLNPLWILVIIGTTVVVVFSFAPYNHPTMDLDDCEHSACKKYARIRCIQLTIVCFTCLGFGLHEIANGISLGCTMTSSLLVFAKLIERRKPNDSTEDHGEQCASVVIQQND